MRSISDTRFLVVDDSRLCRLLVKDILSDYGAIVDEAKDGAEAMGKADADVILMDIQMPNMNGYEVAKELRKQGSKATIIGLSAFEFDEEQKEWFNGYIRKPFSLDNLLKVL